MPPLLPQPGVLRCDVLFSASLDSSITARSFYTYSGTPPSDASCVALASDCATNANTRYRALMDSDHAVVSATITDLTSPTSGTGTFVDTNAGTRVGAFLPAGVCALVNYAISRRYRGGKPRNYFPFGVAPDLQNNSQWTTTFQGQVAAAVAGFHSDFVGVTFSGTTITAHVNVSYYLGSTERTSGSPPYQRGKTVSTPRTVAIAPDLITGVSCNLKPGSQRRRNAA